MPTPSQHVVTPNQVEAALMALGLSCPGHTPGTPPLSAPSIHAPGTALTKVQGEIVKALTRKPPLNERQVAVLEVYWQAAKAGEPALPVDAVATRLIQKLQIDPLKAADFVKGALRSFGKRLFAELSKVPVQFGKDVMGDGVADEIPLLAMFDIAKGSMGEARHKLTPDGVVAVAAALAMNGKGKAAASVADETYNPDEVVALGMSHGSAALIMRVAQSKGLGVDETVKLMTAMMGAG